MNVKRNIHLLIGCAAIVMATFQNTNAQKINEERMVRDIRVSENVLATLIKQKFDGKRMFFPLSVSGSYQEGYGVTFSLPADYTTPILFSFPDDDQAILGVSSGDHVPAQVQMEEDTRREWKLKDRKQANLDSLRDISNDRLIEASKEFLADYGDILSQVSDNEKIIITNHGDQPRMWVVNLMNTANRTHLSIELAKADLNQFKQGKISRDQLMERIKVINAEAVDEVEPDLELLSTIFNRLYRPDLSKTYFTEGNIYYERLKDFGVVYYMQVFSASRTFNGTYDMPTVGLHGIDQDVRDKKVKELYPVFEKDLKENVLEYGRTLKSLKDDEALVFNVKVTRCDSCGIPSTLEVSVNGSVLKDYSANKIDKSAAFNKITVKRGADQ